MTLAFWAYAFAVVFVRARAIVLERERDADWVRELRSLQGAVAMNWNSAASSSPWAATASTSGARTRVTLRCMAVEPGCALRRRRRALSAALASPTGSAAMKPRHKRLRDRRRHRRRRRRRRRAGAQRVPEQPGVLLLADAGRGAAKRRRARTFRIGGLVEQGQRASATASTVQLRRHRHRADDPGALRRHPSRPVQGRQGRRRAGPARRRRRVRRARGARQARRELHAARSAPTR